jgi:acetyl esterase/lipase
MTTIDQVAAEHRELVGQFPEFNPREEGALNTFRRNLVEGFTQMLPPVRYPAEERLIPSLSGGPDVRILVHRPREGLSTGGGILYIHGGGMIAGSADMMAGASEALAQELLSVVIAIDYRFAPEAPFPAGLEDCHSALVWLHSNGQEIGIDPDRIAVMGDSGGGGLAAATTLLARDRKSAPIKAQVLLYPMLDVRTGTSEAPVDNPQTGEFVWTRDHNRYAWQAVIGSRDIPEHQRRYLSPALAEDVANLPPTFVLVGSLDLFLEEDVAYAMRLARSGVPIDFVMCAGAVHGFDRLPGPLGENASACLIEAIAKML